MQKETKDQPSKFQAVPDDFVFLDEGKSKEE